MQSAQELSTEKAAATGRREMAALEAAARDGNRMLDRDGTPPTTQAQNAQMLAASNGAADPVGLQLDAQHLGTLMRNDRSLRLGFLSAGGWDTHANQGNASGQLANNLGNLGRGIMQLRQDFSEPGDVVVVMSEFGRTASENGTRGTDHGYGNAMWLVGNNINGGRWHGQWTGLARGNLNESRDLPAHHDYRAVLAHVLRANLRCPTLRWPACCPARAGTTGLTVWCAAADFLFFHQPREHHEQVFYVTAFRHRHRAGQRLHLQRFRANAATSCPCSQRGEGLGKPARPNLKALDVNKDKMLSREEIKGRPMLEKNFDAIDSNKDGQLTRAEMKTYS